LVGFAWNHWPDVVEYPGMLSGKVGDSISKKSSDRVGKQRQVGVAVQKTLSGHR
jgi:hypothetical protein